MDQITRMPQVWDLSLEEAQLVLREAGLAFSISYALSNVVPEGILLSVSPRPGQELNDVVEIILTVSTGPPRTAG